MSKDDSITYVHSVINISSRTLAANIMGCDEFGRWFDAYAVAVAIEKVSGKNRTE